MANPWTTEQIPDQGGRTAVVTGATSGLGEAAAAAPAARGARVVLAVRDTDRGERAAAAMRPGAAGSVEVAHLDLADLSSVRSFAQGWSGDLDVLVDNAGIMMVPQGTTADGFELQLGTNHLGHFALTCLLLPHLRDRVVVLSSGAHRWGAGVDVDDLMWERRGYSPTAAYGQSKLANLLFVLELQRRLTAAGSTVRAVAAHPGYAATRLQRRTGSRVQDALMRVGNTVVAQSAAAGAQPTLFAATADLPGGSYAGPSGRGELRGTPTLVGRSQAACDVELAGALWAASERLTGVVPDLPARG